MISLELFIRLLKEYSSLTGVLVKKEMADALYEKVKNKPEEDISQAIEQMSYHGEKLSLANLMKRINYAQTIRIEREAAERNRKEREELERLWKSEHEGNTNCKWGQCRNCLKLYNCPTRREEWLKGIKLIFRARIGEARKRAEEHIFYMQNEFMGGI